MLKVNGRPIAREVREACGFWGRAAGLIGRRSWPEDTALLIRPCRAIHTIGMRFAIDVLFTDAEGNITGVMRSVPPGRVMIRGGRSARYVYEFTAGSLDGIEIRPGDLLTRAG